MDDEIDEQSGYELDGTGSPDNEPLPVSYNPAIPIETFDFIITDECHRSIYNLWRQVLEYFDAFLIGESLLLAEDPAAKLRSLAAGAGGGA